MNAIHYLRVHIFQCSQQALADLLGVSQAHISRCERGVTSPSLAELARLRAMVMDRGFAWNDAWFFDPPHVPPPRAIAAA